MLPRGIRGKKLRAESLETRQLLAGDVSAVLNGTNLVILGDVEANAIQIAGTDVENQIVVTGLNDGNNVPTGINGAANGTATFDNVRSISVRLLDGDDQVNLLGLELARRVSIETGEGNDTVNATATAEVVESASLAGDSQGRFFGFLDRFLDRIIQRTQLSISTGDGNDDVTLQGAEQVPLSVPATAGTSLRGNVWTLVGYLDRRVVSVDLGDGENSLVAANLDIDGSLKVVGGDDADNVTLIGAVAKRVWVHTGDGADNVLAEGAVNGVPAVLQNGENGDGNGSLHVDLGDGTNSFVANGAPVHRSLTVMGGDDSDTVALTGALAHYTSIYTGDGEDDVTVAGPTVADGDEEVLSESGEAHGALYVALGNGADSFAASGSLAAYMAVFGGEGEDDIEISNALAEYVALLTGGGADTVAIDGLIAEGALIATGEGEDGVSIHNAQFQGLAVALGGDNDALTIGTTTSERTRLNGQGGTNAFTDEGTNSLGDLTVLNFV